MLRILLPGLGAVLLLLLLYDVLITVFHPQGRGGPLSGWQNAAVWRVFRAFGRRGDGSIRWHFLGFCGPVMAVLTIAVWGIVLVLGFALIYYPWIHRFPVSPGSASLPWATALYYSGYVGSTLGIGDVVAPTAALRLLTVAQAWGGFVLIPVSITYVLAVYRELGFASTLSLSTSGFFRQGPKVVRERVHDSRDDDVAVWARETASGLLRITQAHAQYPVLHYFHSVERDQALLVQVGNLVEFLWDTDEDIATETAETSPAFDALKMAVEAHLHVVERDIVPPDFPPQEAEDEDAPIPQKYRRVLRYLLYDEPRDEGEGSGPGGSPGEHNSVGRPAGARFVRHRRQS